MPLYAGGAVSANRRRAAEQFNAARENRINLTRNTVTASRSLHMTVTSDVARVKARKQAIKSTQSALDATVAGYEVGTRNIVDVLNAQNAVFAAQRDYANSRYDYVLNSMRLKENAGTLSIHAKHRKQRQWYHSSLQKEGQQREIEPPKLDKYARFPTRQLS